jgi:hypothetical protein
VNDPAVAASQGAEIVAVYQQLDTLLRASNTIVFPTFTTGRGGGGLSMMQSYWLRRAFDRYVQEGADLENELADAQALALAYQDCAQDRGTYPDAQQQQGEMFSRSPSAPRVLIRPSAREQPLT